MRSDASNIKEKMEVTKRAGVLSYKERMMEEKVFDYENGDWFKN